MEILGICYWQCGTKIIQCISGPSKFDTKSVVNVGIRWYIKSCSILCSLAQAFSDNISKTKKYKPSTNVPHKKHLEVIFILISLVEMKYTHEKIDVD